MPPNHVETWSWYKIRRGDEISEVLEFKKKKMIIISFVISAMQDWNNYELIYNVFELNLQQRFEAIYER